MDDAVRLFCPECELIYRAKALRPGKDYKCRKCGSSLRGMDPIGSGDDSVSGDRAADVDESAGVESGIADENLAAMSSTRRILGPGKRDGGADRHSAALSRLEEQVSRLSGLVDSVLERTGGPVVRGAAADAETGGPHEGLDRLLDEMEGRLSDLGRKFDGNVSALLSERVTEAGDMLRSRLDEHRAAVQALNAETADAGGPDGRTVEIDIQDLADRLAAGIRAGSAPTGSESVSAVDGLARVAEELVREQSINSARLTTLAEETKRALAALVKLDEWRGDLPIQVADEIGRTVEERVVGPISSALARQAPAILSDMQDSKLVDVVSRSVREAQRPLLREILAGGRGGAPLWLFASILLPLLLILGYLFLPGEFGFGGDDASPTAIESMSENLARMESDGVPLTADVDDRIRNVEAAVLDIHAQAMTHARNAAALEEEVKSLKATLAERDGLIKDYTETLQKQVGRLRAYEMTLTRLGVSPESATE